MTPPITLFVRSYPKDFQWLEYSIISMKKFLTGVTHKILVVPRETHIPNAIREFFDEVIGSYLYQNLDGYVAQQFDKLDAYTYVDTDYILYSDSDCIYTAPFDTSILFKHGLPILCMTPYSQLEGDGGYNWKAITEKILGFRVTHEFMRRFPIIHRTQTVADLTKDYPNLASKIVGRNISEFNLMGAYARRYKHLYYFTEDCSPIPCRQFWSWSGLTEEEHQIIKDILA